MGRWSVTYEIVTPESAEVGDVAEASFEAERVSLREAIHAIGYGYRPGSPVGLENAGRWWRTIDGHVDYRTGAETRYTIHPPRTITPASMARVDRLLTGRTRS